MIPTQTVRSAVGADRSPGRVTDAFADPEAVPLERVEAEICTLAGQIAAATSRFLRLLADFDERDGWAGWGVRSCAHWLSWRCGLDLRTAREHVRIARSLRDLPAVADAFDEGQISYSKVRAIARVATNDNETDLLDAALHAPAAHLERLVRGLRTVRRIESEESTASTLPGVQWRWDEDGRLVIWGRLAPEDGARLLAAVSRMDDELRRTAGQDGSAEPAAGGERGPAEPATACDDRDATPVQGVAGVPPANLAPGLVAAAQLVCTTVEAPVHAPAAEVVVHVDAKALTAACAGSDEPGSPDASVDDGPPLPPSTVRQLACDARIQLSVDGPDGRTLDLGRTRRRPSRRQLSALWRRDRGCTAPGCDRTRFLHAHHVVPWARGGPTSLDNLVLLCGEHHRALHEGEFVITALGRQRFRCNGPRGADRPAAPGTGGRGGADALAAAHPGITPSTIEPDWDGSPLDLHAAVSAFAAPCAAG